jgi:hypothetical protein
MVALNVAKDIEPVLMLARQGRFDEAATATSALLLRAPPMRPSTPWRAHWPCSVAGWRKRSPIWTRRWQGALRIAWRVPI